MSRIRSKNGDQRNWKWQWWGLRRRIRCGNGRAHNTAVWLWWSRQHQRCQYCRRSVSLKWARLHVTRPRRWVPGSIILSSRLASESVQAIWYHIYTVWMSIYAYHYSVWVTDRCYRYNIQTQPWNISGLFSVVLCIYNCCGFYWNKIN